MYGYGMGKAMDGWMDEYTDECVHVHVCVHVSCGGKPVLLFRYHLPLTQGLLMPSQWSQC